MDAAIDLPKITYLSWMDRVTSGSTLPQLIPRLLLLLAVWYIIASLPLWLSGQWVLTYHYIWLLGGGGLFLAFLVYAGFAPLLNFHVANIDQIICESDTEQFRYKLGENFKNLHPQKSTYQLSVAALAFFTGLIGVTWCLDTSIVAFSFLGPVWYQGNAGLPWRIICLILAVTPVILIGVTGFRLMLAMINVIQVVDRVGFIPSPRACQRKVMPTLKLLLGISFMFSTFAAFFIILFQEQLWPLIPLSWLYWAVIVSIIFTGMIGVLYPIHVVSKKIKLIKDKRLDVITQQVISLTKKNDIDSIKAIIELYRLEEQLELNNRVDSLFMGWKYFSSFALSILFPLTIAVAQIFLQEAVTG